MKNTPAENEQYNEIGKNYGKAAAEYMEQGLDSGRLFIDKVLGNIQNKTLLDVGCGTGLDAKRYEVAGANVFGIDPSSVMVEQAKQNVLTPEHISIGEYLNIQFPEKTFDCVTGRFSIHYVEDIPAAIRELARVMKSGGTLALIISHPTADAMEEKMFSRNNRTYVHITLYGGKVTLEYPLHSFSDYLSKDFFKYFDLLELIEYKGTERDSRAPLTTFGISAQRK